MSRNRDKPSAAPLEALLRHPDIRAVVQLDREGTVENQLGDAQSLKIGPEDPTVMMPIDTASEEAEESLYVCDHDDHYIVVVFGDTDIDFEQFKQDVDETLAQWK